MLTLEGATAALTLDCHGKKENVISLQQEVSIGHTIYEAPVLASRADTRASKSLINVCCIAICSF